MSRAATRLRIGQPTVSRRLAQLEHDLGASLFRRLATGVVLTSAGERLLPAAKKMGEFAGEISRKAAQNGTEPHGIVRIAAPPGVAFEFVAPFAGWLQQRHPELRLEVVSTVEYLDLARGEAHLALRMRPPTSADLTVVGALHHRNGAFVSPDYAKTLPLKPAFRDIRWIAWAPPYDQLPPNPQLAALIPNFEPSFSSDNFLVQRRAAEAGVGAVILGGANHRFATSSTLVPLDLDLGAFARGDIYLVSAKSALGISRVRRVAGLLIDELSLIEAPLKRSGKSAASR